MKELWYFSGLSEYLILISVFFFTFFSNETNIFFRVLESNASTCQQPIRNVYSADIHRIQPTQDLNIWEIPLVHFQQPSLESVLFLLRRSLVLPSTMTLPASFPQNFHLEHPSHLAVACDFCFHSVLGIVLYDSEPKNLSPPLEWRLIISLCNNENLPSTPHSHPNWLKKTIPNFTKEKCKSLGIEPKGNRVPWCGLNATPGLDEYATRMLSRSQICRMALKHAVIFTS